MHAVVNRLRLNSAIPPDVWARAQAELPSRTRGIQGVDAFHVFELGPEDLVRIIVAETPETLDRIASEVGNTWMREHVLPHLAEPPSRQIGKVVASSAMS